MQSLARKEVVILWVLSAIVFAAVIAHFTSFTSKVDDFGDNGAYLQAAGAIRGWNFQNVTTKQFWGLSYVIATASSFPKISPRTALLAVCAASSLLTVLLAYELWGGWIAAYFAIINFDWMQRSFLGGAEPLFMALLLASFLYARKERWIWASFFAALASVVRPLAVFALVAIALVLLTRKEYRRLVTCTAVGFCVGMLYLLPFWLYFHDPLYQIHRYEHSDWKSGALLSFPFRAQFESTLHGHQPLTNVLLILGWSVFVIVGFLAMTRKSFRSYVDEHRSEFLFAFFYVAFLFTYNSDWARADFPRFAIPIVPFVLKALEPWLPKSRGLVYPLCLVGTILGACSALGIRNVVATLR